MLALVSSPDLENWTVDKIVMASTDVKYHGFQYVDWQFDGKDIILMNRVGFSDEFGEADNAHNSNYIIFQRIRNYKKSKTTKELLRFVNK